MVTWSKFSQVLALTPTPVPVPTVTVTQTIIVPTAFPTPVVTIVPPDEKFDLLKDVFLGDFFGALIGAAAALSATYWLISRERNARQDERRRAKAEVLAASLREFFKVLRIEDSARHTAAWNAVVDQMLIVGVTGVRIDPHRAFRKWLNVQHDELKKLWDEPAGPGRTERQIDVTRKMLSGLIVWIDTPERWRLNKQEEEEFLTEDSSDTPDTLSPRPSE